MNAAAEMAPACHRFTVLRASVSIERRESGTRAQHGVRKLASRDLDVREIAAFEGDGLLQPPDDLIADTACRVRPTLIARQPISRAAE